jgi:hypothetical protein
MTANNLRAALLVALCFFSGPVAAQTYYEAPAPFGGPWIVRNDLGTLPDNNDDLAVVPHKELINETFDGSDQKYLGIARAFGGACTTYNGQSGCTQASLILWFQRKATANVKLIFETAAPIFHLLNPGGGPIWVGISPQGACYTPYPPYANYARVWGTNHTTKNNMSMVVLPPWPNDIQPGQHLELLIDPISPAAGTGRNRMWVIAE